MRKAGFLIVLMILPALVYGFEYEIAKPSYDSGWLAFAQNEIKILTHNLGGNINDYVVDMQYRDAGANKVNQIYFGCDDGDRFGAIWDKLTTSSIRIDRGLIDVNCDEIRVRIWKIPRANYDSGWMNIAQGQAINLAHHIGGSSDDYVVYLELKDNESYGIHQRGYGGSIRVPELMPVYLGALWQNLNSSTVQVLRGADDMGADQVRIRIWKASHPDYDSGWQASGTETVFHHNLGGPWNDYVVDLQFKDTENYGVNHKFYGGGTSSYDEGAYWQGLNASQVSVDRQSGANHIDKVRVRIWKCSAPKYDSGWFSLSTGASHAFTHSLGGNAADYVVDLQFKDSIFSVNNRYYGSRKCYDSFSIYTRYRGADWYGLDNSQVRVYRAGDDAMADQVRVRLWVPPSPDYDSGWTSISAGTSQTFNHGLGGSEDNYVVYLEFKNSAGGGVHQTIYGGDKWWDASDVLWLYGAFWDNLSSTSVRVTRHQNDTMIEQIRVRIWKNDPTPVPRYAWKDDWGSYEGSIPTTRSHNIGGNVDDYVLDMRFNASGLFFKNHRFYGSIYGKNERSGAYFQSLNTSSLQVVRELNDGNASQIMLCIWNTGYVEKTIYIAGHIAEGGFPLSGVTLSFSGTGGGICITDAGGNYSMSLPYNYTGTATPSLTGHVFTPASSNYNSLKTNAQTDYSASTVMLIAITSPLGSALWNAGVAHNITWTTTGPVGNLKIELLKGGSPASIIVLCTSNDGLEAWTPSRTLPAGSDYQIKITDTANPAVTTASSYFTIVNNNPINSNFRHSGSWTGAGHGTDGWYVGDFNGDGKDDIFRYVPGTSGADVLLSNGTKFIYSRSWTGAGYGTDGWYVGDFNGDNKDDIFRYVPGTSGADVFLSNGTKFIYSGSWTGAGHGTDGWYVGDFNGDGKDDIFRYVPGTSGADVLLSNGTKFIYSGSWTGAGHGTDGWYIGDFNGDGKDDIFRYVPGTSGADVLLSNGTKFIHSGSWTTADHGADGWYVGDYNGDAKDDIFRYVAGVSGADVYLADCTQGSGSAMTSYDAVSLFDEDMIKDFLGTRDTAMNYQQEEEFLSPFIGRLLTGDVPTIYEIKQAYEEIVGQRVRKAVINQLLSRHHYWDLVEQQSKIR